jgi:hypothetical protein
MSIERGPFQTMLKSENFPFFPKTIFSNKFEHTVGIFLKNAIIDEILLDNLKGLSGNGDFSRLRKLTLTPDLHQWKI